jgi:hypothetical protein
MANLLSTQRSFVGSLLIFGVLMPILLLSSLAPTRAAPIAANDAGAELSPGYDQLANPGTIITYTHILTNTGTNTDTFALDMTSSQGWPVSLLSETGPLSLSLQLDAGLTTTFMISLSVPTAAISGTVDMAVITATSQTSPTVLAIATDTTTVENVTWYIYLPLVLKRWPPIPDVPVLNSITNPNNEGTYNVTWNAAYLATTYILEEDDNSAFSSPTTQYTGTDTSRFITYQQGGTYYYRVKANNSWGDSGWSNVQATTALPGIHGWVTYQGNPISGTTINLVLSNHWSYSTIGTATTQVDGAYQFVNLPTLIIGQLYTPFYFSTASSSFVDFCRGASLKSYIAGASVWGGNFDIANIPQVSPPNGATIALPYTFQWTKRSGVPSDSYKLAISNDHVWWSTDPSGYVSGYTMNNLPSGLSFGTPYYWSVVVDTTATDGICKSFDEYRTVTFSSGVADSQDLIKRSRRLHNEDIQR